ncbi:protein-disulfide reductase DsbD domain-containing protein [Mariniflexile litorale]|uniref:Protein-disulfide reductase DsbD domain-containing protein n=1 Tax=Mariniflexile litorale TaxID=3045158 RepID=A0AAU7EBI5_9FLAO|nr:protein-disulfide reductase DsbD domain-containing protein [Mariniflexile sp. KMM 9835]MDQ8213476.1 protein-disulfide reductase DsbD family protein [Mariniflexile sp. KMM 9835]
MKLITILSVLLGTAALSAQILTPAHWSSRLSKEAIRPGETVELIFSVRLDRNWHLYSNVQNYKIGPLPAVFEFKPHSSYKLLEGVVAIGSQKEYDPVFEVYVNYFENTAEFRQKVKILSKNPIIKGFYEYQVCSIADGKCVMGTGDFEFKIQTIKQI